MKATLLTLVLIALLGALVYTNPAPESFETYIQHRVEERMAAEGGGRGLGRLLTDLGSAIVGSLAARVSDRSNYGLFSIYTVDVGADGDPDEAWKFLAVGGQFIELSSPRSD